MTTMSIGRRLAEIVEEAGALIRPLWRAELTVHTKADVPPSGSATFAERATWQLGEAQVNWTRSRQLVMVGLWFVAASYAPMSITSPTIRGKPLPR